MGNKISLLTITDATDWQALAESESVYSGHLTADPDNSDVVLWRWSASPANQHPLIPGANTGHLPQIDLAEIEVKHAADDKVYFEGYAQ